MYNKRPVERRGTSANVGRREQRNAQSQLYGQFRAEILDIAAKYNV